ncbi:peptide alpha-N-acetyltransferase MAK3 [Aspergillus aculeatinus CBS 121060]|uniref:Acyl-CoA N-acyltransferase n=1 Tax=Aspergillus aculeatinus CBS 121060 TaxID=1448322 RepID=A0ACD1H2M9_9EURO|nr:acyl-CoA N-acyltransferase [Aspergillus aculeatinus CBS 121060]RAH67754.1 acyl-CoA N-acyltransferase [Aspergillus aculeatinus CBS 121060]
MNPNPPPALSSTATAAAAAAPTTTTTTAPTPSTTTTTSTTTPTNPTTTATTTNTHTPLRYVRYDGAREDEYVPAMRQLISKDLSEPYSIYVYRYFLYQWGDLCFMAMDDSASSSASPASETTASSSPQQQQQQPRMVGVVVSKLEPHRGGPLRGYIAMLAVKEEYRGRGIATKLARMAIDAMIERDADEIVLETEITNTAAIKLYERLGFLRSKRLHRYYLNGNSAYRLVLYLKEGVGSMRTTLDPYGAGAAPASGPPYPLPLPGGGGDPSRGVGGGAEMTGALAAPEPALLHENGSGGW